MRDFSDLVPDEYYSSHIPTMHQHSFCYIGRENLCLFAEYWEKKARELSKKGNADNLELEDRICNVSEAEECRNKAERLKELAIYSGSKPLLFGQGHYRTGQHITCFISNPSRKLPEELRRADCFVDATVVAVRRHGSQVSYKIRLRKQTDENQQLYTFIPDGVSVVSTEDFHYFRVHPNFFRLYLSIHATTDSEKDKIKSILSAL